MLPAASRPTLSAPLGGPLGVGRDIESAGCLKALVAHELGQV